MVTDMRIEGSVREKMLISYYRYRRVVLKLLFVENKIQEELFHLKFSSRYYMLHQDLSIVISTPP